MSTQLVTNLDNRLPVGGEFLGYNGDCTEYAFMTGRTSEDPARPCDRAELDRLTAEAINQGQAGQQGAMTAANLAWLCQREGVPYQQTDGSNWLGVVASYGADIDNPNRRGNAIVVQVANGSAIPGNERSVNGHAVTILMWNGGSQQLTITNGDSVNGRQGQLDVIHFNDITNAQPFALTVLLIPPIQKVDTTGIIVDAQDIIKKASV